MPTNLNTVVVLAGAIGAFTCSTSTSADETRPSVHAKRATSVRVGPLVSIQPGHDDSPYAGPGVGGTTTGFSVALEHVTSWQAILALELSRTAPMEALQEGRFIGPDKGARCDTSFPWLYPQCDPVLAKHTDTLISALVGKRASWAGGAVEVKGGISVVLGKPRLGDLVYDDVAGHVALTAGIDGVIPLGGRVDLVPSLRYSHVWRGDTFYSGVGLGSEILRVGVGVRLRIAN